MIKVLSSGFYSTVQDLGRMNFQSFGVPVSGAMDLIAARMANAIVSNDKDCAVLEMTMVGPKLEFACDTVISITGGDLSPTLNRADISNYKAIVVKQGDVLSFGKLKDGFRTYLAVSGGFLTEVVLHSRSMYHGITNSHFLNNGDLLKIDSNSNLKKKYSSIKSDINHYNTNEICVYKGPEFDKLSTEQQAQLVNQNYTISKDNNRMAYQLNELFKNNIGGIITSLVLPGTVQLTPSGKLIILMRDCQSTGGYPRVLQLSESSINTIAQKFTGEKLKFRLVN